MSKHQNRYITIIVAVKNEEHYIDKCLRSLINQDFPRELYQIAVVDGISTDNTIDIVKRYVEKYPNLIKLYLNPEEWQAAGRNIAIRSNDKSDLIAYIDGHCEADRHWLQTLYNTMKSSTETEIAGVGSIHASPEDESLTGNAIEQVLSSLIGGIGSSFRPVKELKEVTTAPFVLYKREAIEHVGLYDETMKIGEDFILNYKLRKAGYKLLINPQALVYHYKRKNMFSFFIQMYNYGVAKAIAGRKYPTSLKFIHIIPSATLISLTMVGILSVYVAKLKALFILLMFSYFVTLFSFSLFSAWKKRKWQFIIFMPLLYVIEHLAYSVGFLRGLSLKGWKK